MVCCGNPDVHYAVILDDAFEYGHNSKMEGTVQTVRTMSNIRFSAWVALRFHMKALVAPCSQSMRWQHFVHVDSAMY